MTQGLKLELPVVQTLLIRSSEKEEFLTRLSPVIAYAGERENCFDLALFLILIETTISDPPSYILTPFSPFKLTTLIYTLLVHGELAGNYIFSSLKSASTPAKI